MDLHARYISGHGGNLGFFYPQARTHVPKRRAIEILNALISEEQMESVWRKLGKRGATVEGYDYRLYIACLHAVGGFNGAPGLTTSQKRKHLSTIAQRTRSLSATIRESPYLKRYKLADVLSEHQFRRAAELLFRETPVPDNDGAYIVRVASLISFGSIGEYLEALAAAIDEYALEPSSTPKPGDAPASEQFFVRSLVMYFKRTYGIPLYLNVAVVTNAVFHSDWDDERVRGLLR